MYSYASQLPAEAESLTAAPRREKPHWGARKIRERLAGRRHPHPARTLHAVLGRCGLLRRMGRMRHKATGTPLSAGAAPDDLWSTDFKGEFRPGNGRYCYPLTVTGNRASSSCARP